jgi:hypothetical protein
MSALILGLVSFLLQALVLKLAAGFVGAPSSKNTYSTALVVAFGLNVLGMLTLAVPLIGWMVYLVAWFVVIMKVYELDFLQSIGLAIFQVLLKLGLGLLLSLFGWSELAPAALLG